jgi:hypothetical protein
MLEHHSSRWSAAASPGGLIGLILTILSVMAFASAFMGLLDLFEIGVSDIVLFVALGISAFTTFILVYLLISYVTMSYRIDAGELRIRWGLWSASIPYDQIESVEPATDVLGEQATGWQAFWPGYYVGTRNTDIGTIRVVSTLPPRRQILVARSDGEIFAISPERPLLLMEELARVHYQFHAMESGSVPDVVAPQVFTQEVPEEPEPVEHLDAELTADVVESHPHDESHPPGQFEIVDHLGSTPPAPVERAPQSDHEPRDSAQVFGYSGPPSAPQSPPRRQESADRSYGYDSTSQADVHRSEAPDFAESPTDRIYGFGVPPEELTPQPPEPVRSTEERAQRFGTVHEQPDVVGVEQADDSPIQHYAEPDAEQESATEPEGSENAPEVSQPSPPAKPAPDPGPVFGTMMPADQDPAAPRFGVAPPQIEPSYRPVQSDTPVDEDVANQEQPDSEPLDIWFPTPPPERESLQDSYQQFVDAGWTEEQQAVGPARPDSTQFAPPQPVILPAGTPRSQVMQPLTRVFRSEPSPTSPAIRPMIHRDPVSLAFIGAGAVATIAMAAYIFVQWDDIPPSLTLHWNVDGLPGRVGEPREILVLPLIAALVLIANVGLAWSIAQFDRFAARLMLSSTIVVHVVTWIALLMILQ